MKRSAQIVLRVTRVCEVRAEQIGLEKRRSTKNRAIQVRRNEISLCEVRPGQIRVTKIRVHQVRRVQRSPAKADAREVDPGENHAVQSRSVERNQGVRVFSSPDVPRGGTELQQDEGLVAHVSYRTVKLAVGGNGGERRCLVAYSYANAN
jgi:hypothetical protein